MPEFVDLSFLMKNMKPVLHKEEFVYTEICSDFNTILALEPVSIFNNDGVYSLILLKSIADSNNINYKTVYNQIAVSVSPSNEEHEFLAVIAGVFADQGISVNYVSGINKHFLFVPVKKINEAMQLLVDLVTDF